MCNFVPVISISDSAWYIYYQDSTSLLAMVRGSLLTMSTKYFISTCVDNKIVNYKTGPVSAAPWQLDDKAV